VALSNYHSYGLFCGASQIIHIQESWEGPISLNATLVNPPRNLSYAGS
jgi:hypothetical protein